MDKKIQHKDYKSKINSLVLTSGEENLIMGLEDGKMLQISFSVDRGVSDDNIKFDHVINDFHSGKVTLISKECWSNDKYI